MKIVIFGLSISSSWGNGHATIWRGLSKALHQRGHRIVFYERDTDYYRDHRDLERPESCHLRLYRDWAEIRSQARAELEDSDVGIVTSYCPDGIDAANEVCDRRCLSVFYDLDTPVTLLSLKRDGAVAYIGERGLRDFDLVLSYTGGPALSELTDILKAARVAPLYGSVDPEFHIPVKGGMIADLSYLGTYAADRQEGVERLFLEPARRRPQDKFLLGGAQYPDDFPWTRNLLFWRHVAPGDHPEFYGSARLTLNVTRASMAASGFCPSGRLFEAAACGVPIVTDTWPGLEFFFEPQREILPVATSEDVLAAMELSHQELATIARNARERALAQHTAVHRAIEFEAAIAQAGAPFPATGAKEATS